MFLINGEQIKENSFSLNKNNKSLTYSEVHKTLTEQSTQTIVLTKKK